MELAEFKSRLKSGSTDGCFVFSGEEDYRKRYYLAALRSALVEDEAFAAFNHNSYDWQEVDFAALLDDIKSPPMMADKKLIEWKYPSFEKMKESDLGAFERILDELGKTPGVTLAFLVADGEIDLGTVKKPSKTVKRFGDRVSFLDFPKSTDAALLSWLKRHFDAEGVEVSADTLKAMLFRCGHSMDVLHSEVEKLCFFAAANGKREITSADVERVCSSTPECDTFALSNALTERSKAAAFVALDEMKRRRLDPIMIMGMMARTYSELVTVVMLLADGKDRDTIAALTKLHPFKVKNYAAAARKFTPEKARNILEELTRVDTGAKYGGVTGYTAIELFISKCV